MNFISIVRQTLLTLSKNILRTALSITGIVLGVMAVISMLSLGEGAKREVLNMIEQLGKNNVMIRYSDPGQSKRQDNPGGMTRNDVSLISKTFHNIPVGASKSVKAVVYEKNDRVKVEVMAVTPTYQKIRQLHLYQGRFISDLDLKSKNLVAVLGYEAAKMIGIVGAENAYVDINKKLFHVVGILLPREVQKKNVVSVNDYNQSIFIPFGTENSISLHESPDYSEVDEITLMLTDQHNISLFGNMVKSFLLRTHHGVEDFQVVIPQELLKQEQHARHTFSMILAAIAALSLVIGGVGIVNIMLAMVTERTQEIGIRRAVGANKTHIMFQFLMESLTLTSIGTVLGVVLGIIISILMSYLGSWSVAITFWSILIAIGMSSVAGLLSGLYPAYVAANMDPIAALRK